MLLSSCNQGREVTIGFGNMKSIVDLDRSHAHGVERTDPARQRPRGKTAESRHRQEC